MRMRLPRRGRGNVSALLDAACAPARPGELAGEEAAVAAFRAAAASAPPPVPDQPARSRRITAGTTAWIAAIAATATAAGAAFAAVGHERPDRSEARRPTAPAVAQTSAPEAGPADDTTPGAMSSASNKGASPGTASGPNGQPSNAASIAGLCRAYFAWDPSVRAERLRRPAFRRLVQAAGGVEEVADFCRTATANSGGPARPKPGAGKPDGNHGDNAEQGGSPANPAVRTGPPPGRPAGGPGSG